MGHDDVCTKDQSHDTLQQCTRCWMYLCAVLSRGRELNGMHVQRMHLVHETENVCHHY